MGWDDVPGELPISVAQLVVTDLRPYRIPFLERIAGSTDLELSLYVGRPRAGRGAPVVEPVSPVPVVRVRNRHLPFGGHRTIWQSGALGMLRSEAEVLVCPEVVYNLSVWAIRLLHRRFAKRLVFIGFFYRQSGAGLLSRARDRLRRWLVGSASAVIAYTDRGRDEYVAAGGEPGRVFVAHNTLDVERLRAAADAITRDEVDHLRQELGLGDRRVLLFLGRLLAVKRPEVLIEALRQWPAAAPRPAVVMVGDGPERTRLEEMARGLDVRFLGAEYDERRVARCLAVADLLVLPGRVGLTPVHGFASGVPTITTDEKATEQSPEYAYIRDGDNGAILGSADPSVYATELAALLSDDTRLARLRDGAAASTAEVGMDRMAEAFVGAIRRAAGR
jgi:glycosyltransferase involved in cell wall biosynthesis